MKQLNFFGWEFVVEVKKVKSHDEKEIFRLSSDQVTFHFKKFEKLKIGADSGDQYSRNVTSILKKFSILVTVIGIIVTLFSICL